MLLEVVTPYLAQAEHLATARREVHHVYPGEQVLLLARELDWVAKPQLCLHSDVALQVHLWEPVHLLPWWPGMAPQLAALEQQWSPLMPRFHEELFEPHERVWPQV